MADDAYWVSMGKAAKVLCQESAMVRAASGVEARSLAMGAWAGAFALALSEVHPDSIKQAWAAAFMGATWAAGADSLFEKEMSESGVSIDVRKDMMKAAAEYFVEADHRSAAIAGVVEGKSREPRVGSGLNGDFWDDVLNLEALAGVKGDLAWREAALAEREKTRPFFGSAYSSRVRDTWKKAKEVADEALRQSVAYVEEEIESVSASGIWCAECLASLDSDPLAASAELARLSRLGLEVCALGLCGGGNEAWLAVEDSFHLMLSRRANDLAAQARASSQAWSDKFAESLRDAACGWAAVASESKQRGAVFERAFERACWWSELLAKAAPIDLAGAWRDDARMYEAISSLGRDEKQRVAARERLERSGAFENQEAMWAEELAKRAAAAFASASMAARRGSLPVGESEARWRDAAMHIDEAARGGVRAAMTARTVVLRVLEGLSSGMAWDQAADAEAKGWKKVFEAYGVSRAVLPSELGVALGRVAEHLANPSYVFDQEQLDAMKQMAREVDAGRGAMFARVEALELGESVGACNNRAAPGALARSL